MTTWADAMIIGPYRYRLERVWAPHTETLRVVMLNPSTADGTVDDPTIRRLTGFAKRQGAGGITVLNLYAFRATDPRDLERAAAAGVDVVGPENDAYLRILATAGKPILAAWGARAPRERVDAVRRILEPAPLLCLGTTKDGYPRHPLYVRGDAPLVDWQ